MNVMVNLPDSLVKQIGANEKELERRVLESVALEGYRSENLTAFQVGELLGLETPMQVDEFLKRHSAFIEYTEQEIEQQREALRKLLAKR